MKCCSLYHVPKMVWSSFTISPNYGAWLKSFYQSFWERGWNGRTDALANVQAALKINFTKLGKFHINLWLNGVKAVSYSVEFSHFGDIMGKPSKLSLWVYHPSQGETAVLTTPFSRGFLFIILRVLSCLVFIYSKHCVSDCEVNVPRTTWKAGMVSNVSSASVN